MDEYRRQRVRPIAALRAWVQFVKNKEDPKYVYEIIEALQGDALGRAVLEFSHDPLGREILSRRPEVITLLQDHSQLSKLPDGSLGRCYLSFVEKEGLDPFSLMNVSKDIPHGNIARTTTEAWLATQITNSHDLFHVLTGYGRDALGELCMVAFGNEQFKTRAFNLISRLGEFGAKRYFPTFPIGEYFEEARQIGRDSRWLMLSDWEAILSQPITQVRKDFNLTPPRKYHSDLPAIFDYAKKRGFYNKLVA